MKRSLTCPKCDCRKLWHVEQLQEQIYGAFTRIDALHVTLKPSFLGTRGQGEFEVFICVACGYSELYAREMQHMKHDPPNGIRLIDNEPKATLR